MFNKYIYRGILCGDVSIEFPLSFGIYTLTLFVFIIFHFILIKYYSVLIFSLNMRFYGVTVSTLDFESSNPSSNLGRTFIFFFGFVFLNFSKFSQSYSQIENTKKRLTGDMGYRSPHLSHAKRALYHLSYIPSLHSNTLKVHHFYNQFKELVLL